MTISRPIIEEIEASLISNHRGKTRLSYWVEWQLKLNQSKFKASKNPKNSELLILIRKITKSTQTLRVKVFSRY